MKTYEIVETWFFVLLFVAVFTWGAIKMPQMFISSTEIEHSINSNGGVR